MILIKIFFNTILKLNLSPNVMVAISTKIMFCGLPVKFDHAAIVKLEIFSSQFNGFDKIFNEL